MAALVVTGTGSVVVDGLMVVRVSAGFVQVTMVCL
jgi:hypothetical protein